MKLKIKSKILEEDIKSRIKAMNEQMESWCHNYHQLRKIYELNHEEITELLSGKEINND